MSLAPNSMGWGHASFGHGPWGHGPWITFPHTPSFVFDEELSFPVAILQFEDANEQRLLLSTDRGLTLGYEFSDTVSATVQQVGSFFIAAGGPATRFRFTDHRTGLPYIGRFGDQAVSFARGFGMSRSIPRFALKVNRYVTYGEEVAADAPSMWWRLGDANASATVADATANANAATVIGTFRSTTGLLTGDPDGAFTCNGSSGALLVSGLPSLPGTAPVSLEAVLRPAGASGARTYLLNCEDVTGLNGASLRWAGGCVEFARSDGSAADTIRSMPLPVGERAHALATYDGATMSLYVNGQLVAARASSRVIPAAGLFFFLGCDQAATGGFFAGTLDECAVYGTALGAVRAQRHYQAMARP